MGAWEMPCPTPRPGSHRGPPSLHTRMARTCVLLASTVRPGWRDHEAADSGTEPPTQGLPGPLVLGALADPISTLLLPGALAPDLLSSSSAVTSSAEPQSSRPQLPSLRFIYSTAGDVESSGY